MNLQKLKARKLDLEQEKLFSDSNTGVLHVCLCDKTCDNKQSLKALLDMGYNVLIHYIAEDGRIVNLKESDIRNALLDENPFTT